MENETSLQNIPAMTDSDVLLVLPTIDGFNLKQFYKNELNSSEIYHEHYGEWTPQMGIIDERTTKVISRRRSNLHGKLVTTSYVVTNKDSRKHLGDFVDKHIDSLLKVNYIIVNDVLDFLNVTRKDTFVGTWGFYNPKTKKWTGMVGDIEHKGADIGGNITRA